MLVRRPSGKTPLQLVLKPVAEDTGPGYGRGGPLWRVEVSDPAAIPPAAICAIAKMYALTPAELRLAQQLMLGATVQEAADGISVAVATIRSQLSTILRKTGARRQAELIRLLSVVPV
jgi:DNA-binding CsgD family transcriptional regulator